MRLGSASRVLIAAVLPIAPVVAQVKPPFRAPLVVADETDQIVKTLDLNGDGWTDAVGWWTVQQSGGGASWLGHLTGWINDGAGDLVRTWSIEGYTNLVTDPIGVDACEPADLDHDGNEDFVIISGSNVRVYVSNGSSAPDLAIDANVGQALKGVVLADFDGNGDVDIAVEHSDHLSIYRPQLATQTLQLMSTMVTSFSNGGRLVAAELTGDSTPDLLLSGSRLYPVIAGVIQAPTLFSDLVVNPNLRHDAGDLDGDGDVDIVSFEPSNFTDTPSRYRILRRTSASTLVAEPMQFGGPARRLYDVDSDGDLDGVCCGGGTGPVPTNVITSTFRIALNDGTGAFAAAIEIKNMGSRAIAGVADLDHDGDVDLIAGRSVYYADGPIVSQPWSTLGSPSETNPIVARDMDLDGDPDYELRTTDLRKNRGDGVAQDADLTLPAPPAGTTRMGVPQTIDADGDGDLDLLVKLQPTSMELLENVGGGNFVSHGVVADSTGVFSTPFRDALITADVDGDGDKDFVTSYGSFITSALWRNDGAAGFTWRQTFTGAIAVWVGDIDGDRGADIVAIGPYQAPIRPITIAHGFRDGTFGTPQAIPGSSAGTAPDQIAVADFDSDGDMDIAAIFEVDDFHAADAHVFWNDGLGNFTRELLFAGEFLYRTSSSVIAPTVPLVVVAEDVDMDGHTDLVFGPTTASPFAATIVRADPDNAGAFLPAIQQVVYGYESSPVFESPMTFADIDGDGDRDLLTHEAFSNRMFEQPATSARVQLGDGSAGFGGARPVLGATGPFRAGETVHLLLRGLRPGARGFLLVQQSAETSAFGPGIALPQKRTIPFQASGAAGDAAGSGSCSLQFVVPPAMVGRTFACTAHVRDADAVAGLPRSNQLRLTFGL